MQVGHFFIFITAIHLIIVLLGRKACAVWHIPNAKRKISGDRKKELAAALWANRTRVQGQEYNQF